MTTAYGHDRRYDYTYDALGFLSEARYSSTDSVKDFSALYTYDRQANLTSMLQRNKMTQLSLIQMPRKIKREGNRIVSTEVPSPFLPSEPVPDPVVKTGGKEPVEGGIIEIDPRPVLPWFNGKDYGYDANGNLTHDRDRSIAAIAYITQRLLYGAQAARPSYTGRVTGRVTTASGCCMSLFINLLSVSAEDRKQR